MAAENIADQLRDIHLGDPISIWPLAYGWIFIIIFLCFALAYLFYFLYSQYRFNSVKREAKNMVNLIESTYLKDNEAVKAIADMSILFRRLTLAYYSREDVAGLTGESWLVFLNKTGKMTDFDNHPGQLLISAPYQQYTEADVVALCELTRRWIQQVGKK